MLSMRWLAVVLFLLVVLLQHPLWWGKGGWLRVWEVDRQLRQQQAVNGQLQARNAGLDAEVRDLKQGYDAIEERARFELGMVKQDEIFVQTPDQSASEPTAGTGVGKPSPAIAGAGTEPGRQLSARAKER